MTGRAEEGGRVGERAGLRASGSRERRAAGWGLVGRTCAHAAAAAGGACTGRARGTCPTRADSGRGQAGKGVVLQQGAMLCAARGRLHTLPRWELVR